MNDHALQLARFELEAKELGLAEDFLFQTALARYRAQVDMLQRLKEELDQSPATVEREYTKGSPSIYANPLIKEFNSASSAANQTCNLLYRLKADAASAETWEEEDDL